MTDPATTIERLGRRITGAVARLRGRGDDDDGPPPQIVIAGMGDTGLLVATHLGGGFAITGVSTRPALVSGQELGNRLADPEHWRRNFFIPFGRFSRLDHVRMLHGAITEVDTERREVHVEGVDGERSVEPYDILVIASGVTNGFWRHARVEGLAEIEADLDAVNVQIEGARRLAIVGGGPTGVSSAVNLARRHPGKEIHLFFSQDEPLPGYHPRVRTELAAELGRAGVHTHPGHRAVVPEGFAADRLTTGPVTWSTGQEPFEADLTLWAVGEVRPNNSFIPADMLDDRGFVRVDPHLRVEGYADVFAVGDIAASDPHRSSARNWGPFVVTRNIKVLARGRGGRLRRFKAPENRWGSIVGLQDEGMVVFQPTGRSFRVPAWAVQPVLFTFYLHRILYGGLRRSASGGGAPTR